MSPVIVGNLDIAMLSLWAFFGFFIGLVIYLNKESRREGYPLEEESDGRIWPDDLMDGPRKEFHLAHGHGTVYAPPTTPRDPVDIKAVKAWRGAGSPYVPTGNPLVDGIGPAMHKRLNNGGISSFEQLAARTPDELSQILGKTTARLANVETWIVLQELKKASNILFPRQGWIFLGSGRS